MLQCFWESSTPANLHVNIISIYQQRQLTFRKGAATLWRVMTLESVDRGAHKVQSCA